MVLGLKPFPLRHTDTDIDQQNDKYRQPSDWHWGSWKIAARTSDGMFWLISAGSTRRRLHLDHPPPWLYATARRVLATEYRRQQRANRLRRDASPVGPCHGEGPTPSLPSQESPTLWSEMSPIGAGCCRGVGWSVGPAGCVGWSVGPWRFERGPWVRGLRWSFHR